MLSLILTRVDASPHLALEHLSIVVPRALKHKHKHAALKSSASALPRSRFPPSVHPSGRIPSILYPSRNALLSTLLASKRPLRFSGAWEKSTHGVLISMFFESAHLVCKRKWKRTESCKASEEISSPLARRQGPQSPKKLQNLRGRRL